MKKISPFFKCLRDKTPHKGTPYGFFGNPRRVVWFCKRERRLVYACAMGSSRPVI
jgi:hypothetical protein